MKVLGVKRQLIQDVGRIAMGYQVLRAWAVHASDLTSPNTFLTPIRKERRNESW